MNFENHHINKVLKQEQQIKYKIACLNLLTRLQESKDSNEINCFAVLHYIVYTRKKLQKHNVLFMT